MPRAAPFGTQLRKLVEEDRQLTAIRDQRIPTHARHLQKTRVNAFIERIPVLPLEQVFSKPIIVVR